MKKTKKVFKLFTIFDLEKEENWLREMSNKGWFFKKVSFGMVYTFIKGPSEDTIYKIDFNTKIDDMEEYFDLYRQCGWKFICQCFLFKYFKNTDSVLNNKQIGIYNNPSEQLAWLRSRIIFFLSTIGINLFCFYTTVFLENNRGIKFYIATLIFVSYFLIRFLKAYILLKNKVEESECKDYYNKNYFSNLKSIVSLFKIPTLICITLIIIATLLGTVDDSDKSVKAKILRKDISSSFPMKTIEYVTSQKIDNNKICLYGNEERIGIIGLEKYVLNRYKIVTNYSRSITSDNFIIIEELIIRDNKYLLIYGKDEGNEINKIVISDQGRIKSEVSMDDFIKTDDYYFIIQRANRYNKEIILYDKEGNDITDRFNM